MVKKIAIASCSGMSPNGLISRVACDDMSKEKENIISICMGATSGGRKGFDKLIKKYPIIAVNGCDGKCVNNILKQKGIEVANEINVDCELNRKNLKAFDTSRLDENGERCVSLIKNEIEKKILFN